MLTREEIKEILHASRVIRVNTADVHGPLGLEHLAREVSQIMCTAASGNATEARQIQLAKTTWEKLAVLAEKSGQGESQHVTAETLAAAIIEQAIANGPAAT